MLRVFSAVRLPFFSFVFSSFFFPFFFLTFFGMFCGKNTLDVCVNIRRSTQVDGLIGTRNVPDLENAKRSGTGNITYGTNGTSE